MDARERQAIELIRQGQQNLAEAISLLSELYGRIVIALCLVYLPEQREAQKIAEQTFEVAVRGNLEGDSLEVSLLTIARRLSRAKARALEIEQFINPNVQNPRGPLTQKEKEDLMLLRLRHHLHLPWKEIAKIMDISSPAAARVRGMRSAKRLGESKNVRQET